ncbi:MAG TPA: I78 family peptidase inhibitor [Allosphingosinicella sp.]|nr:I78 family peptidase inhibitor [Allosphingosinicella sp.]
MIGTGCAAVPPDVEEIPVHGGGGSCTETRAQPLVGRAATSELGAEAMRLTGANAIRWIQPGSAVTMDYRPGRLNIHLDAQNRVTRFTCG